MMETANFAQKGSAHAKLNDIGKFGRDNPYGACFAELTSRLDVNSDLRKICEALPYDSADFGVIDFTNAMANLGYETKTIKIKLGDVDKRLYPCFFVPDQAEEDNSPKVLITNSVENDEPTLVLFDGVSRERFEIAKQREIYGTAYLFRHFSLKDHKNNALLRKAIGHGWFRMTLERFRGIFAQVFGISIALNIVSLATSLFIMTVYDHVVAARSLDKLSMLAVGVGIAISTEWLLRTLRNKSLAWFAARLDYIVSNAIFGNLVHLPAALVEHGSIAAQVARIKAFESVRDFFTGPLFLVMVELPFTLIILGAIAIISGWLALIPFGIAAVYVMLLAVIRSRMRLAIHASAKATSAKQQSYIETFEKLHSLKTNGMQEVWNNHFRDVSGKSSLIAFKSNMLSAVMDTMAHCLSLMAGLLIVYFGVESVIAGSITPGALVATMILVWRVLTPLQVLCGALPRMEQLKQSIMQVNRLMDIATERTEQVVNNKNAKFKGDISVNRIGLRYNKDSDPVFNGLSFEARHGEMVAIAGGNGMGKSTVLKLLNGLYRPQAGTIRMDGIDIRQINPLELRKQVAYVSQTPEFFNGTISENLRFADPMASDDDIREVLKKVDALAEIEKLPQGLETVISKGLNSKLPSSLTYRINLARAYLKNSPVLLIDELPYELLASKAGDTFKQTLESWKGEKTMVVITHRADFISISDTAVLLRGAENPVVGKPEQILEVLKKTHNNVIIKEQL